jgi:cytochrome c oxidase cbb3-type subunit I/II
MRLAGGTLYFLGMVLMAWNLIVTARSGKAVDGEAEVVVRDLRDGVPTRKIVLGGPVIATFGIGAVFATLAVVNGIAGVFISVVGVVVATVAVVAFRIAAQDGKQVNWHRLLEGRGLVFTVFTLIAALVGGVAEIVPSLVSGTAARHTTAQQPYTPLELEGRDVYLSEGCYTCHSQMIRPLAWEAARYGEPTPPDQSIWDHPFQWGSKRTGPDLARVGSKYQPPWHYLHMMSPQEMTTGSIMPPYPHLADNRVDFTRTAGKMDAMRTVGVPYTDAQIQAAEAQAREQAALIVEAIRAETRAEVAPDSQMVALIAYLQRLGLEQSPYQPGGAAAPVAHAEAAR